MSDVMNPQLQSLVLHFGEMGSRWGINRTVGQIYALLVFSEAALSAEQISQQLGFSRSNVSMGLKELQAWELVTLRHRPGDRKDYFTVPEDLWEIARTLVRKRRKRELEPTAAMLREALSSSGETDGHVQQRMRDALELLELIVVWTDELQNLSRSDVDRLMKLGAGLQKVLEMTRRS